MLLSVFYPLSTKIIFIGVGKKMTISIWLKRGCSAPKKHCDRSQRGISLLDEGFSLRSSFLNRFIPFRENTDSLLPFRPIFQANLVQKKMTGILFQYLQPFVIALYLFCRCFWFGRQSTIGANIYGESTGVFETHTSVHQDYVLSSTIFSFVRGWIMAVACI